MQDSVIVEEGKRWKFDQAVTDVFDDMLERSIPQYNVMRRLTYRIGRRFVSEGTPVIDLGCSRGRAIEPFVDEFGGTNTFSLYDVSDPMLEAASGLYEGNESVTVKKLDIANGIPDSGASLALMVLTLQFTPIEYRMAILSHVYDSLCDGGGLVLVEKVLGDTYNMDSILVSEYYGMKAGSGYTQEQIHNKRKSLEGELVPVTAKWNEELLKKAGFSQVECFWRCLNFAAWIAVK